MTKPEIMAELARRIEAADARYGDFASTHEALGVASEEWDELREAVRSNKLGSVEWEALDLAAVLIRLALSLSGEPMRKRSVK
jgi:NTP pyrophosphatase (non-canonical NTP hydrolase)